MRHTTLLLALAVCTTANAQWTNDASVNTTVRDALAAAATPLSTEAPGGGTYITWFESAPTNYVLKMQLLDADGYRVWDEAGVVVSAEPQNTALFRYDLTTDNEGNAIVAFQDERSGTLQVVVYKVALDGTVVWPEGILLMDGDAEQGLAPSIGVLANNALVVAWNASAGAERWVDYKYVTPEGFITLAPPERIGGSGVKCTRPKVVANMDGGCSIQYVTEVGSFPGVTSMMYAQRFDASLAPVWAAPVQISTRTITFFFFPEPFSDGANGMYLGFTTSNPDNAALNDVYMQRVLAGGSTWSAEGTRAMDGTNGHRLYGGAAFVNEADGLMLAVQVLNAGQSQSGIWMQRFTVGGLRLLGAGGTEALTVSDTYYAPQGIAATPDGALVVHTSGGFAAQDLNVTRVNLFGSVAWDPAITVLSSAASNKANVWNSRFNNDHLVTVWLDDRTNNGVFAQRVNGAGQLDIGTAVPAAASTRDRAVLLDNVGASPILCMELAQAGPILIQAFDAHGALIMERREQRAAGITEQPLSLPDVKGIGLLRVIAPEAAWNLRWSGIE